MKTRYIIYMVSALALAAVSCQQSDLGSDISPNGQMSFKVNTPSAHTRVSDGAFEAQDKIGLYVTDYVAVETPAPLQISGNRANNEAMTYDGTTWTPERPIYWGAYKSDVYAYYPYMEITDIEEQPFSVATDQSVEGAYEASDFLWAKAPGVSQSQGSVFLMMKHSMSRLVVKIMAGEEYIGSLPADATVHLHSTVTDAYISLANGSVVKNPYAGTKSIKMRNLGLRTFAEGEAVVYEAIVVPQVLETSVPLLEINSKSVSYLLEDPFSFQPGVSYTYTAVLNASTTSIKVDIGCSTDNWNNIGGEGEGGSTEDEGVDLSQYTDLSAEGTANCYLIKSAGNYKFRSVVSTTDYTVGNVQSVHVLWETFGTNDMPDIGELIANVGFQNGYVYFSTPETFKNGNASIAVCNSKGLILWSWHIWCSEEGWNDQVYPNNAGTMMDRNLGATSATPGDIGAFGLLYQWGRKDPFMGSCTTSGTKFAASTGSWNVTEYSGNSSSMDFAEENPTTFCTKPNWKNRIEATWRTSDSKKGVYDPCPVGYRVPDGGIDGFWETAIMGVTNDSTNSGIYCTLADGSSAWYPATGYHNYGSRSLLNVGTYGYYWSASTNYNMYFKEDYVNPNKEEGEAYGYAVRCIKDTTPAPKSEPEPDPTLIYTDLSAEGTANCYLVKAAGNYKFKTAQGNSNMLVGDVAAVRVLWESFGTDVMPKVGDLIAEASYKDGYVYFSTPEILKNGNASIAVRDSAGLILWSWHIWCSEEGWNDHVYPNNAGTLMDRNLGATSATPDTVGALGLLYQWGRRDPFMGSSSLSKSIRAASTGCWRIPENIRGGLYYPLTWDTACSNRNWNTSDIKKSRYDPCPVGYRVPDGGKDGFWAVAFGTSSATTIDTALISDFGCYWNLDDGSTAWYPAAGRRDEEGSGKLVGVGSSGYFWTASPSNNTTTTTAYEMYFSDGKVYFSATPNRGRGCSVRCLKE